MSDGSVPARHVSPRARRSARELREIPSLAEIEQRIMRCDDELADLVLELEEVAEAKASAEADWNAHLDKMLVFIADTGDKEASDIRLARARLAKVNPDDPEDQTTGADLYRTWQILQAHEKNLTSALGALKSRLMGLMSVAKGIRGVT